MLGNIKKNFQNLQKRVRNKMVEVKYYCDRCKKEILDCSRQSTITIESESKVVPIEACPRLKTKDIPTTSRL